MRVPRLGLEALQAALVLGAVGVSVFAVVEPALDEVDDTLLRRRAALVEFAALAGDLERVRGLAPELRAVEMSRIDRRAAALLAVWTAAKVSYRLRPSIEMRAIGPVLTLVEAGPRGARASR